MTRAARKARRKRVAAAGETASRLRRAGAALAAIQAPGGSHGRRKPQRSAERRRAIQESAGE